MSLELPKACYGCTKTGMAAIGCPLLSQVSQELIFNIQCGTAHLSQESRVTTSGKALGPVYKDTKPPKVNSSAGRARATHPRIGY